MSMSARKTQEAGTPYIPRAPPSVQIKSWEKKPWRESRSYRANDCGVFEKTEAEAKTENQDMMSVLLTDQLFGFSRL